MGLPLDLKGLFVSAENGRSLLSVPSLAVAPGSCLGVRGPSGAGKSTLLFAIAGLLPHVDGTIRWGSHDLLAAGEEDRAAFRRSHIGMVFQDFLLFEELDAAANAGIAHCYAPPTARKSIRQRARAGLQRLGLDAGPRSVESFSGGERQRVAVARALSNDPDILLADEPTASLDRAAADRLIDDLVSLAREDGKTVIAVSHDTALHARMDRLLTIADGKIVADDRVDG